MHFEYTLTIDDLVEANQPVRKWGYKKRVRRGLMGWLIFFILSIAVIGLFDFWTPSAGRTQNIASWVQLDKTLPTQNFWVTLVPSLVMVLGLIFTILLQTIRSRYRARIAMKSSSSIVTDRPQSQLAGLAFVLPFVLLILPNVPAFAWGWNPTPRQILWVSFSPWIGFAAFVLIVGMLNRKTASIRMFSQSRSLRRSVSLDVTVDEVCVDNQLVTMRLRWASFDRYRDTEHLLILMTEDETKLIIPKRAIPDPSTMDSLMALIQSSIPRGQFLPRELRFPVLPLPVEPIL